MGKGGTDIVERPLLVVVDLRVPEGLELLHRRRRHLPGRIAFLEGLGFRFHSPSLSLSPQPLFFLLRGSASFRPQSLGPGRYWAGWPGSGSGSISFICGPRK